MSKNIDMKPQVLIAVPTEWGDDVGRFQNYLTNQGVSVILATTYEEAEQIIKTYRLSGIVIFAEWAVASKNDVSGLIEGNDIRIPTIFLVDGKSFDQFWAWYRGHYRPSEDYINLPLDPEQVLVMLKRLKVVD